ncbi:adenosylcobinamide kinase/adenosylcobinamide phosphate guanyltransferase [Halobacillus andaensis]|uniref:Adenosylcobinamide kinase n=1 Tax=Halobacillus andaensis TaxID=1176239 RepID=A0A917EZK8_HALAA|nr:bifunctional adenosylcobinamide kinase/adenosylcobinamide-phosphate guanylyltransferase [Halobacillus andaensis]MBP2005186.1 adenosylcobinamide kinase/adenosylcobinamide-phosphate guanylyltransferase [Halobacillus andaensis]GGF29518.1 adenosylcobinamide kinase/adenosylcobinamide phosphate guanyltransferase [Halobacillus andaensis]
MITFICGGVRSGKTGFTEMQMLKSKCENLHYIATGVATDEEMIERVSHHQEDRRKSERAWLTWEQPTKINELTFSWEDAVLLDCITTWVTNKMIQHEDLDPDQLIDGLLNQVEALIAQPGEVYIISNEVSRELPSPFSMVETYKYIVGTMNQHLAARSDQAVEMVFGEPVFHKEVDG